MSDSFLRNFIFWVLMALPLGPTAVNCISYAAALPGNRWMLAPLGSVVASFILSVTVISGWYILPGSAEMLGIAVGVLGGCYLIYIGYRHLRSFSQKHVVAQIADIHLVRPFQDGFLVSMSNPKVLAVYLAILAPASRPGGLFDFNNLMIVAPMLLAAITVYLAYGAAARLLLKVFSYRGFTQATQLIGGATFMFIGTSILIEAVMAVRRGI